MSPAWARASPQGCTLTARVKPRSARPGVEVTEKGLIVRVGAPPARGRANREAARRLADTLGVSPSRVALRAGAGGRVKIFLVAGLEASEAVTLLGGGE